MAKKENVKKESHTFRNVLIVVVVILVIAIIGSAMGGSDDEEETGIMTEILIDESEETGTGTKAVETEVVATEVAETEEEELTDHDKSLALIDSYDCWSIEDGKAYWSAYMVEDARFYDNDFMEVARECVAMTDDPDVSNYAVDVYDSDNILRFYWESDDNRYEITENDGDYYTDSSKLRTYTWELTSNDVNYMLNERDSRY